MIRFSGQWAGEHPVAALVIIGAVLWLIAGGEPAVPFSEWRL